MNYQKELEKIIQKNTSEGVFPKLLIHSCCAPCSSYVLEYLSNHFDITIFFYNPNIFPQDEYDRRVGEQQNLISAMPLLNPVYFLQGDYNPDTFYQGIKGYEAEAEGGERCFLCYELRLLEAGKVAREKGFDYFTTTLSISPHKNSTKLNEIGQRIASLVEVPYLPSDFKKNNGYKRSIDLSKEFGLYRQDYCGCAYSRKERERRN